MQKENQLTGKDYLRPLKLSIFFSVLGETLIFLIWGVFLYPEGNMLHKLLWTIVFCGLGMGAVIGAFIDFFVVGRLTGIPAILATVGISFILLGLLCNYLCFNLDMHFNYFGGQDTPRFFIWNGMIMSAVGGGLIGWLCFTKAGRQILENLGF